MSIVVIAKCIQCGFKREIMAGEIAEGEMPMCPKCYGVMVAESAKRTRLDPKEQP